MRFDVRVTILGDGLVGGDKETGSHFGAWTSWGEAQVPQRVPLVVTPGSQRYDMEPGAMLGPYVLDTEALRGDENITLWFISKTRFADVASIDKDESPYARDRNQQSGSVQVPVARILAALDAKTGVATIADEQMMDTNLIATILLQERMAGRVPNVDRVFNAAHKARATLTVRVSDAQPDQLQAAAKFLVAMQTMGGASLEAHTQARVNAFALGMQSTLGRMVPLSSTEATTGQYKKAAVSAKFANGGSDVAPSVLPEMQPGGPIRNPRTGKLLYVPANFRHFVGALDRFVEIYAKQYIGVIDPQSGQITGPPVYDTTVESIKGLHFAIYRSMVGMLPVIMFWAHAAESRPYATAAERDAALKLYGATEATERYYGTMMRAAARRFGFSEAAFMDIIVKQYARTDATQLPEYVMAKQAIVDVGTFCANAMYYTNDSRYRNPNRVISGEERSMAQRAAEESLAELHKAGEALDIKTPVVDLNAPMGLESFDIGGMLFLIISNDCEDMGNMAGSVLRLIAFGRQDKPGNTWGDPMLNAAQRVLRDHAVLDTGGDVTAAYYGSDGKEMKKNEIKQLPIKNSPEDKRSKTGGHAYGMLASLARCAVWATRGGFRDTPLHARVRDMPPWQARQATLLMEGTGPGDHLLLPPGEVFGEQHELTLKAEAARHLVRDVLSEEAWKPLTDAFRPYSTPFYTKSVEPDRYVTGFYRRAVHAGCVEMYKMHAGMSQVTFINPVTQQRGIDTAEILRDSLRDPKDAVGALGDVVALDIPFYAHADLWKRTLEPVLEAMVNQMPVTGLAMIAHHHAHQPLHFTLMSEQALSKHIGAPSVPSASNMKVQRVLGRHTFAPMGSMEVREPQRFDTPNLAIVAGETLSPNTALRAHSLLGAAWADAVARNPPIGTLDWDRASIGLHLASGLPPVTATRASSEAFRVVAQVVEYRANKPLSQERTLQLYNSSSWAAFKAGTEQWVRTPTNTYTVLNATLTRQPGEADNRLTLRVTMQATGNKQAADSMALLHVTVMNRVFALRPLIINKPLSAVPDQFTWTLSAQDFTQAFCTTEVLEAAPWITLKGDMPNAGMATSVLSALPVMLSLNMGALECQPALAPFASCGMHSDATLVRFVGRDWAVKKNWDAAMKCLQRLYDTGVVLAHEFVVGTPMPQCGEMIEMHLLVKVPAASKS